MPMLKRVNLCVADMDRSFAVYRDVLGFTVSELKTSLPTSYSYPVFQFPAEAKLRFATLDSESQVRVLALTEVTGIKLPPPPVPYIAAVVINCENLDEVLGKLKNMALKVIPERPLLGADGQPKGRETAFFDPDGHLVVLYKLT